MADSLHNEKRPGNGTTRSPAMITGDDPMTAMDHIVQAYASRVMAGRRSARARFVRECHHTKRNRERVDYRRYTVAGLVIREMTR